MPKVTDEYIEGKRNLILECTKEILKEKPLYQITMRDIIKKAGFSQGMIYRYYTNIDEIYLDLINQITLCDPLEQKIDALIGIDRSVKSVVFGCILAIGEYIEELLCSVGGKTSFELLVTYAYDAEKRNAMFPKLRFKQSLEYAQNKIVDYLAEKVLQGALRTTVSIESISLLAGISIDGIMQRVAIDTGKNTEGETGINVPETFQTLAKATVSFLEEPCIEQ